MRGRGGSRKKLNDLIAELAILGRKRRALSRLDITIKAPDQRPGILRRVIRAALPAECRLRIASAACAVMEVAQRVFDATADEPPQRGVNSEPPSDGKPPLSVTTD